MSFFPLPQNVPLVDRKTGMITREWARFLESRFGPSGTAAIDSQIDQMSGAAASFSPMIDDALNPIKRKIASIPAVQQLTQKNEPNLSISTLYEQIDIMKKQIQQLQQRQSP